MDVSASLNYMAIQMALGMLNRIAIYLTFNLQRLSNLIKICGLLVKHVLPQVFEVQRDNLPGARDFQQSY